MQFPRLQNAYLHTLHTLQYLRDIISVHNISYKHQSINIKAILSIISRYLECIKCWNALLHKKPTNCYGTTFFQLSSQKPSFHVKISAVQHVCIILIYI